MKQGLVVSDLHLFSRRSDGQKLWSGTGDEFSQADILVLNGDTFDFRWSRLADEQSTISAALEWIESLIETNHYEAVHYLFGNHDCLSNFKSKLEVLSQGCETLFCHDYQLRLGSSLFLHGDCANRKMNGEALQRYRLGWSEDRPRGPMSKALYDGVDATGLSLCFHQLYFPQNKTVERVAYHLDHVFSEWRDKIDNCYFGHTHRPFTNHTHDGVNFHNTGSGIRGMGFQPLRFSHIPEEE